MYFNKSNNLYFTSDLHFGHRSIVKGVSNWEDKSSCRNFDSIEEHDECLIENINNIVKSEDILFIVGDFTLGDYKQVEYYRKEIKCKTIHFILGNHDPYIQRNKKGIQSLFTTIHNALEIKVFDQKISLNHYAYRVFNQAHRNSWNLFAHSHNSLSDHCEYERIIINGEEYYKKTGKIYKTLDIGVDSAFQKLGEYRPFSYKEIENYMSDKFSMGHH